MAVLAAALAIGACQNTPGPVHAVSEAPEPVAEPQQPTPEVASPEPAQPVEQAVVPMAPPVPTVPAKVYPAPDNLKGLDREAVVKLLGDPGFKRRDTPAEIWRYRAESCILDVFLYRDGSGPVFRVTHFETRHRGSAEELSAKECFVTLLKARENAATG